MEELESFVMIFIMNFLFNSKSSVFILEDPSNRNTRLTSPFVHSVERDKMICVHQLPAATQSAVSATRPIKSELELKKISYNPITILISTTGMI